MAEPISTEGRAFRMPPVGASVRTRDGASLGTVSELSSTSFKVDAPHARDYWLSSEFVLEASSAGVELDFDEDKLDDYKLDGPGSVAADSPILDGTANAFSSAQDRADTREAMEHPPAQS
ncbi:MAG: hypothetical protein ABI305_14220 [Tepidiformaceae bacterium]